MLKFLILTGALADADATFTTLVEHGDAADLSDAAAVPDTQLTGTEADLLRYMVAHPQRVLTREELYRGTDMIHTIDVRQREIAGCCRDDHGSNRIALLLL